MTTVERVSPVAAHKAASPYVPPRTYSPGTRKLRVLLISHTCQSRTEGQPKAHALAKLPDIELHLLTPARWLHYGQWRAAEPPKSPAFACTVAPVRFAWAGPAQSFLHYYPRLPEILRQFRPDVIDLWEEPWSQVSAHACKWRKRVLPSATIVSETEQNILKDLPFPFERFRKFTLAQADYAVARNQEAVGVIRAKGYAGPVEVVPNAVDTALFQSLDRHACRAKLLAALENKPSIEKPFFAGYLGRLVPEKGLLDLLEALPQAPASVHLLLVGGGPLEAELRRRAAELSVVNRVHFLANRPLEQLPELMNALDVLVLPSVATARWKEQFGRVIIEAHACGIPVIGTRSGAIPDVVADAGLLVPEKNPTQLAGALRTLCENPALAQNLGARGLENARALFTWDQVARRMACIYQNVCGTIPTTPA